MKGDPYTTAMIMLHRELDATRRACIMLAWQVEWSESRRLHGRGSDSPKPSCYDVAELVRIELREAGAAVPDVPFDAKECRLSPALELNR